MSALPVLYSFRRCPYAMRARLALAVSGQACELREVVLRAKPAALLAASPKGTVPVLVLPGGQVLEQSLDIMQWALQRHDPAQWLAPSAGTLDAMRALIAECDGPFKQTLDRCKYPNRYPEADPEAERAQALAWLGALDARLSDQAHLFGTHATLADMAIAPFVRQFAGIDADEWKAQPWPRLQDWLARWQASPLLASVMHKLPAWVEGTEGVKFPHADVDWALAGSVGS
ncbi:MAG: glutathione S-transferase [Burkholderiaceae bacterium]|nr:glutathione S-transferase [Burkholderiaceae bacterium]